MKNMYESYYIEADLIKRGWSRKFIKRYLYSPDGKCSSGYRNVPGRNLFLKERVEDMEKKFEHVSDNSYLFNGYLEGSK
jgi:hypothetical protein